MVSLWYNAVYYLCCKFREAFKQWPDVNNVRTQMVFIQDWVKYISPWVSFSLSTQTTRLWCYEFRFKQAERISKNVFVFLHESLFSSSYHTAQKNNQVVLFHRNIYKFNNFLLFLDPLFIFSFMEVCFCQYFICSQYYMGFRKAFLFHSDGLFIYGTCFLSFS